MVSSPISGSKMGQLSQLIDTIEADIVRIRDLDTGLLASLTARLDALREMVKHGCS